MIDFAQTIEKIISLKLCHLLVGRNRGKIYNCFNPLARKAASGQPLRTDLKVPPLQ